jgi:hypothetical protein
MLIYIQELNKKININLKITVMKKLFILLIVVIFGLSFSACTETEITTVVKTTIQTETNPGTEGFVIKVKKGDTVWDFSQKIYGTGFKWRDIVAQNPFLNEPGRVEKKGDKWVVWIYPGEEIRIGNKVVTVDNKNQITETTEKTTTTITEAKTPWEWLWFVVVAVGIILLFLFLSFLFISKRDKNNEEIQVPRGSNPDTIIKVHENKLRYYFWGEIAQTVSDASKANNLKGFTINEGDANRLSMTVNYRNTK